MEILSNIQNGLEKFLFWEARKCRLYNVYIDNGATGTEFQPARNFSGCFRILNPASGLGCDLKDCRAWDAMPLTRDTYISGLFSFNIMVRSSAFTDQFFVDSGETLDNLHGVIIPSAEKYELKKPMRWT